MAAKRTRPLAVALLTLALCACGDEAAEPRRFSAPPADPADLEAMRRLVPTDAALVMGAPSLAVADQALADMSALFGGRAPSLLQPLAAALQGTLFERFIDHDRPLLVALAPSGTSAEPVIVLPVTDAAALRAGLEGVTIHEDGRYLGLSRDPTYTPGNALAPLTAPLPDGQLALRADLASMLAPLRPMAELMVPSMAAQAPAGSMGGMDPAALMSAYVRFVFDGAQAVDSIELGLSMLDGSLDVSGQVDVVPGSPLADIPAAQCDTLDEMVAWLDGGAAMQMVCAIDAGAFAQATRGWMLETVDVWPDTSEDALIEYLATLEVVSRRCGHVFVMDGEFSPGGIDCAYLFEADDADAFVDTLSVFMQQGLEVIGGRAVELIKSSRDGRPSTELVVDMSAMLESSGDDDPAVDQILRQMYGDGVMRYVTTAGDGRVVMAGGTRSESASARLDAPRGNPPQSLLRALDQLDGMHTRAVMRMDYGRMFTTIAGLMQGMPDMQPELVERLRTEHEIPLTLWVGGLGRRWRVGSSLDLAGLAELIKSLQAR
ncbi:MAG: hypothetical protein DRQ55_07085 [Planctomycetota bacterium]|nr:MAG: hypothetical protein DRQ55_07085 [Planctomycetota bacterium]